MSDLKKEFEYYVEHQQELVGKYRGKYLIIKDQEVVGVYDTEMEAYIDGNKKYKAGEFLLQPCLPGEENYSQTFYSRVGI